MIAINTDVAVAYYGIVRHRQAGFAVANLDTAKPTHIMIAAAAAAPLFDLPF